MSPEVLWMLTPIITRLSIADKMLIRGTTVIKKPFQTKTSKVDHSHKNLTSTNYPVKEKTNSRVRLLTWDRENLLKHSLPLMSADKSKSITQERTAEGIPSNMNKTYLELLQCMLQGKSQSLKISGRKETPQRGLLTYLALALPSDKRLHKNHCSQLTL
jgi:hypothetical protein